MSSLEISALDDESTTLSRNFGHHSPNDAAPHCRKSKTSNCKVTFSDSNSWSTSYVLDAGILRYTYIKYVNSFIVRQLCLYNLNLHLEVTLQHIKPFSVKWTFTFWLTVRQLHIRCRYIDATSENLTILYFSTVFNFTSFNQVRYLFYMISSYTPTIISTYISYIKS
jgi:hypothetical protein